MTERNFSASSLQFPITRSVLWDTSTLNNESCELRVPFLPHNTSIAGSLLTGVIKASKRLKNESFNHSKPVLIAQMGAQLTFSPSPMLVVNSCEQFDDRSVVEVDAGEVPVLTYTNTTSAFFSSRTFGLFHTARCRSALSSLSDYITVALLCGGNNDELLAQACIAFPSTVFSLSPIPSLPIFFDSFKSSHAVSDERQIGFLTMNQKRKIVLLSENDPLCSQIPIVGIWVSGLGIGLSQMASSATESRAFLYACLSAYVHSELITDRATMQVNSSQCFLVLLVNKENSSKPLFLQCEITSEVTHSSILLSGSTLCKNDHCADLKLERGAINFTPKTLFSFQHEKESELAHHASEKDSNEKKESIFLFSPINHRQVLSSVLEDTFEEQKLRREENVLSPPKRELKTPLKPKLSQLVTPFAKMSQLNSEQSNEPPIVTLSMQNIKTIFTQLFSDSFIGIGTQIDELKQTCVNLSTKVDESKSTNEELLRSIAERQDEKLLRTISDRQDEILRRIESLSIRLDRVEKERETSSPTTKNLPTPSSSKTDKSSEKKLLPGVLNFDGNVDSLSDTQNVHRSAEFPSERSLRFQLRRTNSDENSRTQRFHNLSSPKENSSSELSTHIYIPQNTNKTKQKYKDFDSNDESHIAIPLFLSETTHKQRARTKTSEITKTKAKKKQNIRKEEMNESEKDSDWYDELSTIDRKYLEK